MNLLFFIIFLQKKCKIIFLHVIMIITYSDKDTNDSAFRVKKDAIKKQFCLLHGI